MKKEILSLVVPFIVGGGLMFLGVSFFGNSEAELDSLAELRVQEAISQLRGELPDTVTNEQLQWYVGGYNAGSRAFRETVVAGVKDSKERGTLSEYYIDVTVDGEVIKFKVQ